MPLVNFGAILNFAETLEQDDIEFYRQAASASLAASWQDLFQAFAEGGRTLISLVQRTRRENVTEMILEPIRDFARDNYLAGAGNAHGMNPDHILDVSMVREHRAIRYYNDAAAKIRALPEVSRALKTMAKKRTKRLDELRHLAG
jgi:rubrerythrin